MLEFDWGHLSSLNQILQVDTLEIALREQLDLVEKLFIVESTVSHRGVSACIELNIYVLGKIEVNYLGCM